jgi:hypothetical protein
MRVIFYFLGDLGDLAFAGATPAFLRSLESPDFSLAALFLWITFFFAALSSKATAFFTACGVFSFFAFFNESFIESRTLSLRSVRVLSLLSFFLADFMTGIGGF